MTPTPGKRQRRPLIARVGGGPAPGKSKLPAGSTGTASTRPGSARAETPRAGAARGGGGAALNNRAGSAPVRPDVADDSELARRRDELAAQFSELQWDLGGVVYEMARRDHFRMDVVVRQAARLQEIDAELGEIERMLRLERAAAAGTCPSCGALYAHGAVFCWQCGESLVARSAVEGRIVPP